MNFTHNEKSTGKNFTGITIVVLLHVLVAYGIVTGLGKRLVSKMIAPVETKIIEEVKPPPPKELPPPPPPPEMKAPPPPFIPPVEVNVQQPPPAQSVISNATNVKPATTEIQKTPPAAPAAAPGPAKSVRTPAVADMSTCAKPEYPKSSLRNEETGVTTVSFLIGVDGSVMESKVTKSSGFRDLDKAAQNALGKCRFKPATVDGKPEQQWQPVQYVWSLD
ncbi:energy transducer TonB [Duganella qianjiadongensis]|uniref:TonB family protein n=1 Tax=Duganella qianjiadongensis TaxID=2692176 RepID=A0ABW9VFT6_9BURK|nr:energy transducer TonB [Duganella qianjiadongensis]MYM38474.1 TonB family protein [Duganella qianjiadongensis]